MRAIIIAIIIAALIGLGIWIWRENRADKDNAADLRSRISAFNQTKNADATTVPASPRDVVVYTLTVENPTDEVVSGHVTEVNIADITELATLIDAQGANYNSANNSLVWTPLDVPQNGSYDKKFTVRVKDSIPTGSDKQMTANFGGDLVVNVDSGVAVAPTPPPVVTPTPQPTPAPKYTAPTTGPESTLVILLAIISAVTVVTYLRKAKTSA
ncbi:MAG TPA: hypothetical protein VD998_04525 [Verrucomicrobiae bacterium]|nr:hypothetical protein [Verrucomicrobiae bacterium]